jgi:hypothetical protein
LEKFTRLLSLRRARRGGPGPIPSKPITSVTKPSDNSWASNFKWPLLLCTASRFLDMCNTKGMIRLRAPHHLPPWKISPLLFRISHYIFHGSGLPLPTYQSAAATALSRHYPSARRDSFGRPQFPPEWRIVLQDTPQKENGWDCRPHTVANCLHIVYAWDRLHDVRPLCMGDFRLRIATLIASQVTDGYWQGRC